MVLVVGCGARRKSVGERIIASRDAVGRCSGGSRVRVRYGVVGW